MRYLEGYRQITNSTPTFEYRFTKYYFDKEESAFVPLEFDYYKTYECLQTTFAQCVQEGKEYDHLVHLYGKCNIKLPEKNLFMMLIEDILNPFYLFQLFSIIIWFLTEYEIYSGCIIFTTLLSIIIETIELKRNFMRLK